MEFGYFTLSDNHYDDNTAAPTSSSPTSSTRRSTPRRSVSIPPGSANIISAHWACSPAPIWCSPTSRHAPTHPLAPAVTVLPLHHPIRVAEQWATLDLLAAAGSISPPAAATTGANAVRVSFEDNQEIFEEGMEIVRRLWSSDGRSRITASTTVRRCRDHATAGAAPTARLCRLVLAALDRTRGQAGLRRHRGALRRGDDLWRAAPGQGTLSRNLRAPRSGPGPADVQLFHPFRRHEGGGGGRAGTADPLLQGMRDRRISRRSRRRRRRATAISSAWSSGCATCVRRT